MLKTKEKQAENNEFDYHEIPDGAEAIGVTEEKEEEDEKEASGGAYQLLTSEEPHDEVVAVANNVSAPAIAIETELSPYEAMKELARFSIPYVFSRGTLAIPWFTDGIILKALGQNVAFAGPTITSIKACMMGFSSSFLTAAGVVGGNQAALGEKLEAEGKLDEAQKKYEEMGRSIRQAHMLAIPLSLSSGLILYYIGPIVKLFHGDLPDEILDNVTGYSRWFALSILPSLWMNGDKQLAMAINKPLIANVNTVSNILMSSAIGYSLALKTDWGIKGMALGCTLSAWLNMIILKAYFQRPEFKKYKLYNYKDPELFKNIKEVLKHGSQIGFFSLTEWANLAIVSTLANHLNKDAMAATQVSFQFMVPYSFAMFAFTQSSGVLIARHRGRREVEVKRNHLENQLICETNIRRIGYTNIMLCSTLGLFSAGIVALARKPFTQLFTQSAFDIAEELLLINCLGVVFDSIRASAAGNLRGLKDTLYPPLISLLFMSIIGLSISAGLVLSNDETEPSWLFTPRVFGLLLSAFGMCARWNKLSASEQSNYNLKAPINQGIFSDKTKKLIPPVDQATTPLLAKSAAEDTVMRLA